jgi:hypothetical protein
MTTPTPHNATAPPVTTDAVPAKLVARSFSYGDGAGNSYELDGATLTVAYKPITAAESSTGTYNGGPAWSHTITQTQYDALVATLDRGIAATAEQTGERGKGTGLILYGASQQAILKMSSPIRKELETQLKALAK